MFPYEILWLSEFLRKAELKCKPHISGIFEKHKLLFSFQINSKLEQDLGNVQQDELDFFIKVGQFCLSWFSIYWHLL